MKLGFGIAATAALATALFAAPASAKTVRIGLIAPFSGSSAVYGTAWKQAIDVFMKEHGDTVGGDKVEIVQRDLTGPNPPQARALAQELIVKEGCQYLAGIVYTPNALALASITEQAHVPLVVFNAATPAILEKSKYILRVSFTTPQVAIPAALYSRTRGWDKMVTMATDYAPGWDAEKYFSDAFEKSGGKVVGKIRMPLSTSDFSPYLQRAQSMGAQAIFGFLPGGGPTFSFLTTYNNSGMRASGVTYLGLAETEEENLPNYGDVVLGVQSSFYYSAAHKSKENEHFVKLMTDAYPKVAVTPNHVDAYDGMTVLYHMIEATHGEKDGDKAIASAMGMKWESPRGPVMIDPKTRDWTQNVYIRTVKKDAAGKLYNDEILLYPMQPDYGREGHPIPTTDQLKPQKLD